MIQEKQLPDAYQISLPTAVFPTSWFDLFNPGTFSYYSWKETFFSWDRSSRTIWCIASNVCPNLIFISFFISYIRELLQIQVYMRHFIDIFYYHFLLEGSFMSNAIGKATVIFYKRWKKKSIQQNIDSQLMTCQPWRQKIKKPLAGRPLSFLSFF